MYVTLADLPSFDILSDIGAFSRWNQVKFQRTN